MGEEGVVEDFILVDMQELINMKYKNGTIGILIITKMDLDTNLEQQLVTRKN